MREPQIEALVNAWLEFQHTPEGTPEWTARRSIVDTFDDLCTIDPERAWAAILRVIELESDDDILGVLAAAPLEDLLSRHGEAFIERVEERARADRRFLRVLRGMWQLSITDEVWGRVKAACGELSSRVDG
jgi:hypothetical protein